MIWRVEYGSPIYHLLMELAKESGSENTRDGRISIKMFRSHVRNSGNGNLSFYQGENGYDRLNEDMPKVIEMIGKYEMKIEPRNPDIINTNPDFSGYGQSKIKL